LPSPPRTQPVVTASITPPVHVPSTTDLDTTPAYDCSADGPDYDFESRRAMAAKDWAPGVRFVPTSKSVKIPFWSLDRMYEEGISILDYRIMRDLCRVNGRRALAIDAGSQFGWFASLFAAMGCRTIAFEPSREKHESPLIQLHANGWISEKTYAELTGSNPPPYPPPRFTGLDAIDNRAGTDQAIIHRTILSYKRVNFKQLGHMDFRPQGDEAADSPRALRLADVANEDILMMKIDIEGAEILALQGILQYLDLGYRIYHIVSEVTPKWWSNFGTEYDYHSGKAGYAVFDELVRRGYDLYVVHSSNRARRYHGFENPNELEAGVDWDTDDLRHVQKIPLEKMHSYFASVQRQLDIWFHLKPDHGGHHLQSFGLHKLQPVVCEKPDEWATSRDNERTCLLV